MTELLLIALLLGLALWLNVPGQNQTLVQQIADLWQHWYKSATISWTYLLLLGWAQG